jgi:hypothetical protein
LRIEIGFKGTLSIELCQFEGMAEAKGHKWRWWSKVFTTWDAGVSDGGRLLRRRLRGEIETQLVEEDFLVSELSSIVRAGL